jgi:hypothetical protein
MAVFWSKCRRIAIERAFVRNRMYIDIGFAIQIASLPNPFARAAIANFGILFLWRTQHWLHGRQARSAAEI